MSCHRPVVDVAASSSSRHPSKLETDDCGPSVYCPSSTDKQLTIRQQQNRDYPRLSTEGTAKSKNGNTTICEETAAESVYPDEVDPFHMNAGPSSKRIQFQALGTFSICVLTIGTVFILVVVAFLAHFWRLSIRARSGERVQNRLWNLMVFSEWASRSITISAAVLRVSLSLQMGVFTAMMASLVIERIGTQAHTAPFLSLLRAMPASPHNLINRANLTMPWRYRVPFNISIALSLITIAAAQLTSTALLSDFRVVDVITPPSTADILYGGIFNREELLMDGAKIWNSQPSSYFRFAEKPRESANRQKSDRHEDTGTILRAFVPFTGESIRVRLREYQGPATVIDSRVVCVRPTVTNVTISVTSPVRGDVLNASAKVDLNNEYSVRGQVRIDPDFDGSPFTHLDPRRDPVPFHCVVPAGGDSDAWAGSRPQTIENIAICSVDSASENPWLPFLPSPLPSAKPSAFLVLNGSGMQWSWMQKIKANGFESRPNLWEASTHNWTTTTEDVWFRIQTDDPDIAVSMSLCLTNLVGYNHNVSMSSGNNGQEPTMSWDKLNELLGRYNTEAIRNQYTGIPNDNKSEDSRGILTLGSKDNWNYEALQDTSAPNQYSIPFTSTADKLPFLREALYDHTVDPSPCGTLRTGERSSRAVHYAHSALFQDVLRETGSLTEALQVMFMVTQQMTYYEVLRYFHQKWPWPITYTMAEEKIIPVGWLGFGLVMSMIGVHLILVIVTTMLFLKATNASRLGNVWMAVGQIFSAETKEVIHECTDKDDAEVRLRLSKTSLAVDSDARRRLKVKANSLNERYELVSRC